jgi:RNA polymerase sigma factor (sigma-70 family)
MREIPPTRHSLLVRLRARSDDAWIEFLQIYERAIYEFARRRGLQDADAWDVTQEVLAAVEQKVQTWESNVARGSFRGWLYCVARNIAVDRVVRQSRRATASGDSRIARMLSAIPEATDEPSTAFRLEYRRVLIRWAVEQIKQDYKESSWRSFLLTTVEDRKPEQVAAELGVSVGSVYAAKFRIVRRIRKLLEKFEQSDTDSQLAQHAPETFSISL